MKRHYHLAGRSAALTAAIVAVLALGSTAAVTSSQLEARQR